MGHLYELTPDFTPRNFCHAKPGPVRRYAAQATTRGGLCLQWHPPAGGRAEFYRIERTRDGHDYETVGETTETCFHYRDPERGEPWFYRVTAVNGRGGGAARLVWFFLRRGNSRGCLLPVPVRPGLRVNICSLEPK